MVRSITRNPARWAGGLALAAGLALTTGTEIAAGKDRELATLARRLLH